MGETGGRERERRGEEREGERAKKNRERGGESVRAQYCTIKEEKESEKERKREREQKKERERESVRAQHCTMEMTEKEQEREREKEGKREREQKRERERGGESVRAQHCTIKEDALSCHTHSLNLTVRISPKKQVKGASISNSSASWWRRKNWISERTTRPWGVGLLEKRVYNFCMVEKTPLIRALFNWHSTSRMEIHSHRH